MTHVQGMVIHCDVGNPAEQRNVRQGKLWQSGARKSNSKLFTGFSLTLKFDSTSGRCNHSLRVLISTTIQDMHEPRYMGWGANWEEYGMGYNQEQADFGQGA